MKTANNLTKMIDAGLGEKVRSPRSGVAVGNNMNPDIIETLLDDVEELQDDVTDIQEDVAGLKSALSNMLFDDSVLSNRNVYIDTNGKIRDTTDFGASNFIRIAPNMKFAILAPTTQTGTGACAIAFYRTNDENSFISGQPSYTGNDDILVAAPESANYVRFSYSARGVFRCVAMFCDSLANIYDNISTVIKYHADVVIKQTDFTTTGKYISTNGTLADNSAFKVSDFYAITDKVKEIKIEKSGNIVGGYNVAFYATNDFTTDSFISGVGFPSAIETETTIEVPDRAKYVAFCGRGTASMSIKIVYVNLKEEVDRLPYGGKKVSFLGDSITSFQNYIPAGNNYYYPHAPNLTDVENTWWKQLIESAGMELLVNNSYSGAKMSGSSSTSGLSRSENLDDGNTVPDIVIVYMGVNDFESDAPLGACGLDSESYSVNNFSDAYYTALHNIKTKYPNAEIYVCTIMQYGTAFPNNNGNNYLYEYNDAIVKLASIFGASVIDFAKCGISIFNRTANTIDNLHPNIAGHFLMYREALKHFTH